MYPVEYEINIYDDIDKKERIIHGITFAENFTEAMSNIEEYYGKDIIDIKLFMNEESSVYELDASDYHLDTWFKISNLEKTF